jgi:multicomponent Na+:H+ antiporter subunit G
VFVFELLGSLMIAAGLFFVIIGTIGLLRMPDLYTRMHATTKCDTLGAGLILMGLAVYQGVHWTSLKLLLIIWFVWTTNPTAAHAIGRAAYHTHRHLREQIPLWSQSELKEHHEREVVKK